MRNRLLVLGSWYVSSNSSQVVLSRAEVCVCVCVGGGGGCSLTPAMRGGGGRGLKMRLTTR